MAFKPWEANYPDAKPFLKKELDPKLALTTWGVMYCGGKNKLLESLIDVTKEIGLNLHKESFDW